MKNQVRFLLLMDGSTRAVLLDGDNRVLGEVIEEDGFIVDSLLRSASECPCPDDGMLRAVVPPPSPDHRVRWFELH